MFIRLRHPHECVVLFIHSLLYSVHERSLRQAQTATTNRHTREINQAEKGEGRFPRMGEGVVRTMRDTIVLDQLIEKP